MPALQALMGLQQGFTFEVEVVAQHATELPVPPGARSLFVLKRRHRLCVTDAEEVDAGGGVEWNTRCTQTATLFKQGDSWRPKDFTLKVQVVRDNPRLGQDPTQTVAKACLDFSQFCMPEPYGPKQLVIPLQPCGMLSVSIRTQWLQNFNQEADSLTDISMLSLGQSAVTSIAGAALTAEEQDLSGFDSGAAGTSSGGPHDSSIRAVWQPQLAAAAGGGSSGTALPGTTPVLKKRLAAAASLRLPTLRGGGGGAGRGVQQQQQGSLTARGPATSAEFEFGRPAAAAGPGLHRSATLPSLSLENAAAAAASSSGGDGSSAARASSRRPAGASLLLIPDPHAAAGSGAGEAPTPTLFGRPGTSKQQPRQPRMSAPAVMGLPPEAWSPIDLQEAVDQLYDSEEEPTPKPSMLGTVKRIFSGRQRNSWSTPPGSFTARQLHETFGTPPPTPPACSPDPCEVATLDRENSVSTLRRRCKQLMAERDEARAEGYAEAALAVEQSLEIDKLKRAKDNLLQRLSTTEQQLLACFRDEASTDLIQALATARVEVAQRDFHILELQGELRKKDAIIDKLRAQLTRAETKYRLEVASPGKERALLPPWSAGPASPAAQAGVGLQQADDTPCASQASSLAAQQQQRRVAEGSPHVLPLLHGAAAVSPAGS